MIQHLNDLTIGDHVGRSLVDSAENGITRKFRGYEDDRRHRRTSDCQSEYDKGV